MFMGLLPMDCTVYSLTEPRTTSHKVGLEPPINALQLDLWSHSSQLRFRPFR